MLKHIIIGAAAMALAACGASAGQGNTQGPDASLAPLPWAGFYERAAKAFQDGKSDEAVTLFYIGQLRGRIVIECQSPPPDRDPALFASFQQTLGAPINGYAGGSPDGWAAAIDQALAWDAAHPDPNAASAQCRAERDRQRAGLTELRDHIRANKDEIRRERTANGLPNR